MSAPEPTRRRRFVDLTPLRVSPRFRWLWIGSAVAGVGAQLTIVAAGLQIYDITRDTLAVALVGVIALVPMIVAGLWGGMLADAVDRKGLLLVTALVSWLSTVGLVVVSAVDAGLEAQGERVAVWPFYVLTTLNSVTAVMQMSTRQAIIPRILPAEMVSRAAAMAAKRRRRRNEARDRAHWTSISKRNRRSDFSHKHSWLPTISANGLGRYGDRHCLFISLE